MIFQLRDLKPSFAEQDANTPLYLFIDGGQVDNLATRLYQLSSHLDIEPMYLYAPYDALKSVSPYIIRATAEVRQWFFSLNDITAGFFFSSDAPLDHLRDYYRRFIQVQAPYGSDVMLKMAHSEVAWVLLSHADSPFWGAIQTAWLPTRLGWQVLHAPKTPIALDDETMFVLNDKVWEELGRIAWRNSLETIAAHLDRCFPEERSKQSDFGRWIDAHAATGYQQGFTTERDLLQYFNVLACVGDNPKHIEKRHPNIYTLMTKPSVSTPSQRIEKAAEMAWAYYETSVQGKVGE
ncbi:DUF4123 domain-containing protein [Vibrio zhugei]|uniref:DUF4123 domain-containing protein n=1 Tax=Vibrio zhugei TaxID=2479546 RepID=A0ABV7CB92_9VIBR|nr:DUF4123 domain-containing protein [Vibrio zhugei]